MPKSIGDVKKALEAIEGGDELIAAVDSTISDLNKKVKEEKDRGVKEVNKRNSEAEGLRKYKKALESVGFDPEETELDDFVGGISDNLKSLKDITEGKTKDGDFDITKIPAFQEQQKALKKFQRDLDKANSRAEQAEKDKESLRKKTHNGILRTELMKTFGDKVHGPTLLVDNLISNGRVKLEDDEKTVVFIEGDDTIEYDEGIKKTLEEHKDIIKNNQSGGSGSGGSGSKGGDTGDARKKHQDWVDEFNSSR